MLRKNTDSMQYLQYKLHKYKYILDLVYITFCTASLQYVPSIFLITRTFLSTFLLFYTDGTVFCPNLAG
jgi:hypothetical protein